MKHKHKFKHMNPSKAHHEPIWQVARATTAAPIFFESIKIGGDEFFDGAIGANNPAFNAFSEIRHKEQHAPGLFVSIGTGVKKSEEDKKTPELRKGQKRKLFTSDRIDEMPGKQFLKKYLELHKMLKDFSVETEETTNRWLEVCDTNKTKGRRFNVENGLGPIPLDDWRPSHSGEATLQKFQDLTEQYLKLEETDKDLEDCAENLVRQRQSRAQTERWEGFATNVEYYCPFPTCKDKDACRYSEGDDCRHRLLEHFANVHQEFVQANPNDIEAFLDAGRFLSGPRSKEYDRIYDSLRQIGKRGANCSA